MGCECRAAAAAGVLQGTWPTRSALGHDTFDRFVGLYQEQLKSGRHVKQHNIILGLMANIIKNLIMETILIVMQFFLNQKRFHHM